jgi:hypothetical protein
MASISASSSSVTQSSLDLVCVMVARLVASTDATLNTHDRFRRFRFGPKREEMRAELLREYIRLDVLGQSGAARGKGQPL